MYRSPLVHHCSASGAKREEDSGLHELSLRSSAVMLNAVALTGEKLPNAPHFGRFSPVSAVAAVEVFARCR